MIFRQLFDYDTWTYTYLLADEETKEAVIIDSVLEQADRDATLIRELGLNLKYIMDTHVHADHITGVATLKKFFSNAQSVISTHGGTLCSDIVVTEGDSIDFGKYSIRVLSTPGHTNGCISFSVDGKLFTGDSLFIRGCGRTDFQQGDAALMYDSIMTKLFTFPDETEIYPGHNYVGIEKSTIGEEKKYNPRLAGKTKEEFIEIMENLNLPYPKKIQESVPANLHCGDVTTLTSN